MLAKEKLMMKKQLQALEEFNIASENRMSHRPFSQTENWCEPKLNAKLYDNNRLNRRHREMNVDKLEV